MAPPVHWIADGSEYLILSVTKDSIVFEIAHESLYANPGATAFDGFVISDISRPIKKVRVKKKSATLIIKATLTNDNEVEVDMRGLSPAGKGFILEFEFDE